MTNKTAWSIIRDALESAMRIDEQYIGGTVTYEGRSAMTDALAREVDDAIQALPAVAASGSPPSPKSCRWTVQDEDMGGQFATECGKLWMFTTDGIKENGAKFCPYCGGSITERASSGSTGAPLNQPTPNEAYNEGLEWAAQWITNTPTMPESREREFAINLATSIYAARRGIRYHIDGDCLFAGAVVCPEIDLITASAAEAREEAERRWIELGYTVRECVVRLGPLAQLGAGSTGHSKADVVTLRPDWKPDAWTNVEHSGAGSTGGAPTRDERD